MAAIALAALILAWFVWTAVYGLLLVFFAVIVAVALDGLARLLRIGLRIPRAAAVAICTLGLLASLGLGLALGGMGVAARAPQLQQQLTHSIDNISRTLQRSGFAQGLMSEADVAVSDDASSPITSLGKRLKGQISGLLSVTVSLLIDIFIIVVVGIYLALEPRLYREPLLSLFPPAQQQRIRDILAEIGDALQRWLIGRGIAMASVAVFTIGGLYLIDIQFPIFLGLIAGLLTFIPYLGAIVAAIPALLVAGLQGFGAVFYVGLVYLGAHVIEGYLLMPLVQQRAVSIPPGYLLICQALGGVIAGMLGVMLATPIALVIAVIVQVGYVGAIMGGTPHLPGQRSTSRSCGGQS